MSPIIYHQQLQVRQVLHRQRARGANTRIATMWLRRRITTNTFQHCPAEPASGGSRDNTNRENGRWPRHHKRRNSILVPRHTTPEPHSHSDLTFCSMSPNGQSQRAAAESPSACSTPYVRAHGRVERFRPCAEMERRLASPSPSTILSPPPALDPTKLPVPQFSSCPDRPPGH